MRGRAPELPARPSAPRPRRPPSWSRRGLLRAVGSDKPRPVGPPATPRGAGRGAAHPSPWQRPVPACSAGLRTGLPRPRPFAEPGSFPEPGAAARGSSGAGVLRGRPGCALCSRSPAAPRQGPRKDGQGNGEAARHLTPAVGGPLKVGAASGPHCPGAAASRAPVGPSPGLPTGQACLPQPQSRGKEAVAAGTASPSHTMSGPGPCRPAGPCSTGAGAPASGWQPPVGLSGREAHSYLLSSGARLPWGQPLRELCCQLSPASTPPPF